MLHLNYLAFGIPAFFLFLYIEYAIAVRLKKQHIFKYESSVSNISIGIAERLINLLIAGAFYSLFSYIYQHYAVFEIPNSWWVWLLLILATDLVWYWYHRLGHQVNFLWAAHIVHHQSEEFNLTVAARITTFQALIRNVFWCVLPFLGFHPTLVITILAVHGAYSFFTHTQLIPKIKWLEYVFVTPSLHGVHHASNEVYLDKNFGDVFVFWDKLFGTFTSEHEVPKYGLTHPIKSSSFLWQHFHYYLELFEAAKKENSFFAKVKVFFANPATLDQDIRPVLEKRYLQQVLKKKRKTKFRKYITLQLLLCVALLTYATANYSNLVVMDKGFLVFFVLLTLINCGALLEQRHWIYYLECFRIILLSSFVLYKLQLFEYLLVPTLLVISLEQFFSLNQYYKVYVLKYKDR